MDMSALGGSGIAIEVKGNDMKTLRRTASDIAKRVESVKGTKNVSDGQEETTPDIHVTVDKAKAAKYGLTVATVYQQLSSKIQEGSTATTISQNEKQWDVKVSNDTKDNITRAQLKKMKLTGTKKGESREVALSKVASFSDTDSLSTISRSAQERILNVTAELEDGYNIGIVSQNVTKALKGYKAPAGYSYKVTGEMESINDTAGQVGLMLILAIAFMYLIMVAQFQSLKSPFIILFTIPLAFTGGLSGIIVNNGIVLVDTINQLRDKGYELMDAVITAGSMRIRPILMTAITTILGLSTMALGLGSGAEMVQPMAIVTIGGLIYGTLLTLIFIPCIYLVFNRKKKRQRS